MLFCVTSARQRREKGAVRLTVAMVERSSCKRERHNTLAYGARWSTAIEHVVSEVLHLKNIGICSPMQCLVEVRLESPGCDDTGLILWGLSLLKAGYAAHQIARRPGG